MKSIWILCLLLPILFLLPGCYTTLQFTGRTAYVVSDPVSLPPTTIDYIPEYCPEPVPPPDPPTRSDDQRLTHTGRGPTDTTPWEERNSENNSGTRDSGVQRGGR